MADQSYQKLVAHFSNLVYKLNSLTRQGSKLMPYLTYPALNAVISMQDTSLRLRRLFAGANVCQDYTFPIEEGSFIGDNIALLQESATFFRDFKFDPAVKYLPSCEAIAVLDTVDLALDSLHSTVNDLYQLNSKRF